MPQEEHCHGVSGAEIERVVCSLSERLQQRLG